MGQVYTSGLIVHPSILLCKERKLPLEGQVLAEVGDHVHAQDIIAKSETPGLIQTLHLSEKLGIDPKDILRVLKIPIGSYVEKGEILAESRGLFGWFHTSAASEYSGILKSVSEVTGHVFIEEPAHIITVLAFMEGKVVQVIQNEGVIIESLVSLVQGVFGVGGENYGAIRVAVSSASEVLTAEHVLESDKRKVLVGGAGVTQNALEKASEVKVSGIIIGSIEDLDLMNFMGYEIGVALTGQENIPFTLVLTEGFGKLEMAARTFNLLCSLDGQFASMSGVTQVRAGVVRPEVILPQKEKLAHLYSFSFDRLELQQGRIVRIVCEPYFGKIGTVVGLPFDLMILESGVQARVVKVDLEGGGEVFVPRSNVEILSPLAS